MGIWNKSRTFSFDEECEAILEWGRDKYAPRFDEPRSRSLFLRFIVKQWASYTRVMLAMPEIMQAVVRASQQTNLPRVGVIQFPLQSAAGEGGPATGARGVGPLLKFSRLANRAAWDVERAAYFPPISCKESHVGRRVAA